MLAQSLNSAFRRPLIERKPFAITITTLAVKAFALAYPGHALDSLGFAPHLL